MRINDIISAWEQFADKVEPQETIVPMQIVSGDDDATTADSLLPDPTTENTAIRFYPGFEDKGQYFINKLKELNAKVEAHDAKEFGEFKDALPGLLDELYKELERHSAYMQKKPQDPIHQEYFMLVLITAMNINYFSTSLQDTANIDVDETFKVIYKELEEIITDAQKAKATVPFELASKLRHFVLNINAFSKAITPQGGWAMQIDNIWFHPENFSRLNVNNQHVNFKEAFANLLSEYVAYFKKAKSEDRLEVFFNSHPASFVCIEGALYSTNNNCLKNIGLEKKENAEENPLTKFIEKLPKGSLENIHENAEIINAFEVIRLSYFKESFDSLMNEEIGYEEFMRQIHYKLGLMGISHEMDVVIKDFIKNYVNSVLYIDEDYVPKAADIDSDAEQTTKIFTNLVINKEQREEGSGRDSLFTGAVAVATRNYQNTQDYKNLIKLLQAAIAELNSYDRLATIKFNDMVETEPVTGEKLIQPLAHLAIRSKDAMVIKLVFSLPNVDLKIVNPTNGETILQVMAQFDGKSINELGYFISKILSQNMFEELSLLVDNNNDTFLHKALKNIGLTQSKALELLEVVFANKSDEFIKNIILKADNNQYNLLALAAGRGFNKVVKFLIEKYIHAILNLEGDKFAAIKALFSPGEDFKHSAIFMAWYNFNLETLAELAKAGATMLMPVTQMGLLQGAIVDPLGQLFSPLKDYLPVAKTFLDESTLPKAYWATMIHQKATAQTTSISGEVSLRALLRHISEGMTLPEEINSWMNRESTQIISSQGFDVYIHLSQQDQVMAILSSYLLWLKFPQYMEYPDINKGIQYFVRSTIKAVYDVLHNKKFSLLCGAFVTLAIFSVLMYLTYFELGRSGQERDKYHSELYHFCHDYGGKTNYYLDNSFKSKCCKSDKECISRYDEYAEIYHLYSKNKGIHICIILFYVATAMYFSITGLIDFCTRRFMKPATFILGRVIDTILFSPVTIANYFLNNSNPYNMNGIHSRENIQIIKNYLQSFFEFVNNNQLCPLHITLPTSDQVQYARPKQLVQYLESAMVVYNHIVNEGIVPQAIPEPTLLKYAALPVSPPALTMSPARI